MQRLRVRFDAVDSDGDGVVTKGSLLAAAQGDSALVAVFEEICLQAARQGGAVGRFAHEHGRYFQAPQASKKNQ